MMVARGGCVQEFCKECKTWGPKHRHDNPFEALRYLNRPLEEVLDILGVEEATKEEEDTDLLSEYQELRARPGFAPFGASIEERLEAEKDRIHLATFYERTYETLLEAAQKANTLLQRVQDFSALDTEAQRAATREHVSRIVIEVLEPALALVAKELKKEEE